MKKIILVLAVLAFAMTAMPAFAAVTNVDDGTDDAVLSLNSGSSAYEIALSPNVTAQYTVGPNATGQAQQWWVAGTFHSGGTFTYGTAANVTKIYKMKNDDSDRLDEMPTTIQSESDWSDNGWDL